MNAASILNIVVLVAVFALVFSLWCFCVFVWLGQYLSRLKKIQQRLGLVKTETADESKMLSLWRDSQESAGAGQAKTLGSIQKKLKRIANDAGWQASVQTVLLGLSGVCLLAVIVLYVLTGNLVVALVGILVVVFGFNAITSWRINKRSALFESQLVDALGIAARSLRAGHPLSGSFQLISEEIGPPLGDAFYRMCQEQALGIDFKKSIRDVASETSNSELRLFATAVAIQLQSGGNLADLMDSLGSVIRARIRLTRRVRVLTAQTNLSTSILIGLPIFLFFLLNILAPTYMAPLYNTTIGLYVLGLTTISVIFGWWIMKRISVLRF